MTVEEKRAGKVWLPHGADAGTFAGDRLLALGACRDHRYVDADRRRDELKVFLRHLGQVLEPIGGTDVRFPAGHRLVDGRHLFEGVAFAGESRRFLAVVPVTCGDLNRRQAVEDVELGDGELGEAVDHRRVTEGDEVEPSAAARPAGRGAKLVTGLPEQLAG